MVELQQATRRQKSTTPGPGGISASFFKGLNQHSLSLLLQVYNEIWASGQLPPDWRSSLIIPIPKPGRPKRSLDSYRPIALTATMTKICERMIVQRLCTHLTQSRLLDPRLLGFLPFRDSQTAVEFLRLQIDSAKREKKHFLGVALDIQQAYDSVHVDSLIYKCAQLGITGRSLHWIHRLLNARSISVRWRNTVSHACSSGRGVPQGSVLSPLLFAIYMSDFFESLGSGVNGVVYADDIFLFCAKDCLDDCRDCLQHTLLSVATWCHYWKLRVRSEKCSAIVLSRKRGFCTNDLSFDGGIIPWADCIKFLGFIFARYGGLRRHVSYLRKKAFLRINLLKALACKSYGARSLHLLTLVATTIRSLLDYGAPSLSHCSPSLFLNIEVIQNSALRVALGLPRWTPILLLRKHANFISVRDRISCLGARYWIRQRALGQWSSLYSFFDSPGDAASSITDAFHCSPDRLISFCFPLSHHQAAASIHLADFDFQDRSLIPAMVVPLFQDFLSSLRGDYVIIATDASKSANITSIAGYGDTGSFGYRVSDINSIFTAEALAICSALDELIWSDQSVVMLSDSKSVLEALLHCSIKSPKVILYLHNKIFRASDRGITVKLIWVPGHRGIWWNEQADRLAKSVNHSDVFLDWISPEDLLSLISRKAHCGMEQQFRGSKYFHTHGDTPSARSSHAWVGSRRLDVLVSRLVCRMLITPALLSRFHLVSSALCHSCNSPDTIDHILFDCQRYRALRCCFWSLPGGSMAIFPSFAKFIDTLISSSTFCQKTIQLLLAMNRF